MSNPTKLNPPLTSSDSIEDVERQLKLLQLRRAMRDEQLLAEQEDSIRKSRDAGIETIKMQMRQAEQNQASCGHLKENGRSNLAGQKDHSGILHLLCQRCQKTFTGNQVPPHLQPMMEHVGGPNN